MSRMLRTRLAVGLVMASFTLLSTGMPGYILPAYGQAQPQLSRLSPQFVTEPGCPVEVTSASTELEVDPFGAPMAARHYIDWSNSTGQAIVGVKFRVGYVSDDGKIYQTFAAVWPMAAGTPPQGPGSQISFKWRGEKVDPKTREVKLRVLQVKFADGGVWMSEKAKQQAAAAQQPEGFAALQPDVAGDNQIADRSPGSPVPLTETGKNYKGYPDRTTTETVPFKSVQTPAPGFDPNAFGGTGAPLTAAPAGAAPAFSGGSAPSAAAGWGTAPAATAPAAGGWDGAPAAAPTAAPVKPAPVAAPPAAPATPPMDLSDPLAAFDKLMGNSAKSKTPAAPAAPAASTQAPAAASPAIATPDTTSSTPAVAPAAATPAASPSSAPAAPAADNSAGGPAPGATPPATPAPADDFAN